MVRWTCEFHTILKKNYFRMKEKKLNYFNKISIFVT